MWLYIGGVVGLLLFARWYYFAQKVYPVVLERARIQARHKDNEDELGGLRAREETENLLNATVSALMQIPYVDHPLIALAMFWALFHAVRQVRKEPCTCPSCSETTQ